MILHNKRPIFKKKKNLELLQYFEINHSQEIMRVLSKLEYSYKVQKKVCIVSHISTEREREKGGGELNIH